ncbi:DNA-directed RNA polymerase subunit alpha C-terminal domain-containing protein [Novipirellula artificiosorum]|uniref:DNA-directed RNA polymerase subunit alpha n=1 Tax=Novipirellula artificiosorum TaxID=2528016 RepID=A0A5C6E107_9BACT|nr:DNA-directed RNA polymerase subunit alpha C-terminal domain-containing protein [Novipirellula artificiosorum]TWU41036.1 DNA-directed RNA polymerase subunit alpha [Novipirellula artificiosorum]
MNEIELDMVDLKEMVLANNSFGPSDVASIRAAITENYGHFGELRDAVNEMEEQEARSPAAQTKLGVCLFLLGKFRNSLNTLQKADGSAMALFYTGRAHFELGHFEEAIEAYEQSQKSGYNDDDCKIRIAESHRYAGRTDKALEILDNIFGPSEQTSEYMYQRAATVALVGGRLEEALALYQRAVNTDENHAGALFGLALENERLGNDEEALRLYERAVKAFPTGIGALINLGLIYEDNNQFDKAQACYRRILESYPDHPQTNLYLKDAAATGNLLYDEEAQRRNDRLAQTLNMPVANFELSVRSRNCLQKMGIDTIGDLTRTSEAELLSSKNFGETSLYEIREMLTSKGLSLGQFAHEKKSSDPPIDTSHMSADEQAFLERPISDLNLSVRARKCMARLQLNTIGELLRKTGDEMLECKNFGVTSLNEVREKLTDLGLKLRGD